MGDTLEGAGHGGRVGGCCRCSGDRRGPPTSLACLQVRGGPQLGLVHSQAGGRSWLGGWS